MAPRHEPWNPGEKRPCCDCGGLFAYDGFTSARTTTGVSRRCRECQSKKQSAWAQRNPGRAALNNRRYLVRNRARYMAARKARAKREPWKVHAQQVVAAALRAGKLVRQPCEICGKKAQAHHDDYAKPLQVRWLCQKHHSEHHKILRQKEIAFMTTTTAPAVIQSALAQTSLFDNYSTGLPARLQFCAELLKGGMLPQHIKSPQAALTIILRGQELGFAPMQSLEMFHWIQGVPTLKAIALQGLAIARGAGVFNVVEETNEAVEVVATRPNGFKGSARFTMQDAKQAGLAGKENWQKWPKSMMYARCVSILCKRGWPDVIGGLDCYEVMQDEVTPTPAIDATFTRTEPEAPKYPLMEHTTKAKKAEETANQALTRTAMERGETWAYDWNLAGKEMPPEAYKKLKRSLFVAGAVPDGNGYLHCTGAVPELEAYFVSGPGPKTEAAAA